MKYLPALRQVIEVEADEARRDAALLPGFKALRLNMGVRDHEVVMLLSAETWADCELIEADPVGGWVLGIDLGQNAAMSAACGYWWRTGLVRSVAMFAEVPDLEERGRKDHVGDLYQRMHQRGELLTTPGAVVAPEALLGDVVDRWGAPAAIVGDRYREAELRAALKAAKWPVIPLVLRGQGFRDGAEDVRAFRRACLAGEVAPEVSLLLRSAMAEATGVSDPSGNVKLAKSSEGGRRQLARDDAAAACILAVSQGVKRRAKDTGNNTVKLRVA